MGLFSGAELHSVLSGAVCPVERGTRKKFKIPSPPVYELAFHSRTAIFTVRKLRKGNIFTPVCDSVHWRVYTPCWADTPPQDGHCSGRYTSYQNAFLCKNCFHRVRCKGLFTPDKNGSEVEKEQKISKRDQRINNSICDKLQRKCSLRFRSV